MVAIRFRLGSRARFEKGVEKLMTTSSAPARVPERQPEPNTTSRPASSANAKKPNRFVIKIAGTIPL
jgi:hypothetical protein